MRITPESYDMFLTHSGDSKLESSMKIKHNKAYVLFIKIVIRVVHKFVSFE